MPQSKRLYERATAATRALDPLWHIEAGRTLFAGPLQFNESHRHSVPVYIAGLYAPFGIRGAAGNWLTCRAAVVPPGTSYELDVGGNPLAVLYLEPSIAGVDALVPLLACPDGMNGILVGNVGETSLLRELYEAGAGDRWASGALDDLLGFAMRRALRTLDPRVSRVVHDMHTRFGDLTSVEVLARSVGLSPSRFQHLFAEQVGVPIRRYRGWHRLRAAIREIVSGSNFTTAAHAAGFSDQAHFAKAFRKTFGAPASRSLSRVRV